MRLRLRKAAPAPPFDAGDPWQALEGADAVLLARVEAGTEPVPRGYLSREHFRLHVARTIGAEPWPAAGAAYGDDVAAEGVPAETHRPACLAKVGGSHDHEGEAVAEMPGGTPR